MSTPTVPTNVLPKLRIESLSKTYGEVVALQPTDLSVAAGEFLTLLGPSGSGKTTLLQMICGLIEPTAGRVILDGRDDTHTPTHQRDIGLVFQNYALFPHLSVAENIAFPLRMRDLSETAIAQRLSDALAMVQMEQFGHRFPRELSGGQQQRVALARAIVIAPRVLLCDEPLGALDKKLRQQMQFELKQLQKKLGLTLVFVTHDQEEALAMSDRIAVMNGGRVEQVGTPTEIYNQPTTRFVADFIGDTNIFRGERTTTSAGASALDVGKGLILALPSSEAQGTGVLSVALRPEKIRLIPRADATAAGSSAHGTVENTNFLGGAVLYRITLEGGHRVLVQQPNAGTSRLFVPGNGVTLDWTPADLVVLKD